MRPAVVAALAVLALAPAALAAPAPTSAVYDSKGHLVQTEFAPPDTAPKLSKKRASDIAIKYPKVAAWLKHYPRVISYDSTYDPKSLAWTVHVYSGKAGEVARVKVDDATANVTEAFTGAQVAWGMARGGPGAFGGTKINNPWIWFGFCAAFFVGLADLRRLSSLRNLDLFALLFFSVSLWYFNRGDIFTSVPLAYPPLVYLLGRALWIGARGRGTGTRPFWPVWVLVAATVFLAGFRIGLNVEASNVIDVGYAGPIGAERIVKEHKAPYGHFPVEDDLKPCGPADASGEIRERIQTNGRCESANPQADTYGPVAYEAYIPAYLVFGWSGKWDSLPTAHATAILFDLLCIVGLADLRRFGSLRNLDLFALLFFSVSLWYFNRGDIFTSVPLAYPPLVYLGCRAVWIGVRGRGRATRPVWPVWVLVAATVFLAGFRVGLNIEASNVIDVGFAGPIGAQRIVHEHEAPYGHFPQEDDLKACGPADANGEIRERIQTNGRCEAANPQADTYGPVSYLSYIPGYLAFGWSGKWDSLPAAHATAILFDLLCIVGLWLVGLRFGGARLGATLAFAWTAYPFTQYASSSNTNDAIVPAFLIFGFWLATSAFNRGFFCALSGWTKFASLVVAPMWLTYPDWRECVRRRSAFFFVGGFAVATLLAFSVLLFEPSLGHAIRVFYDRTIKSQVDRESPFSLWDWRQYRAKGIPDLHRVQQALEALLVVGAVAAAFFPQRKSPLQLAALTGALLIGFELVLTHWFYLYIPWFFPFVAIAVLAAPLAVPETVEEPEPSGHPVRELVPAG